MAALLRTRRGLGVAPSLVADATSDMAITTPFLSSTVTTRVAKIGLNVHYWQAKRLFTARRARGWSG